MQWYTVGCRQLCCAHTQSSTLPVFHCSFGIVYVFHMVKFMFRLPVSSGRTMESNKSVEMLLLLLSRGTFDSTFECKWILANEHKCAMQIGCTQQKAKTWISITTTTCIATCHRPTHTAQHKQHQASNRSIVRRCERTNTENLKNFYISPSDSVCRVISLCE